MRNLTVTPRRLFSRTTGFVFFTSLLFVMVFSGYSTGRIQSGWNGIIPLHSVRADVERQLGTPSGECHCAYSTPNEAITVYYAEGPCKGPPYGWRVAAGTVLTITVFPKKQSILSESELLAQNYVKTRNIDGPTVHYTNVERGIKYSVQNGMINSISYMPSSRDLGLRCAGFPAYNGGLHQYQPFASFSSKAQLINERLDQFAAQLTHSRNVKGYIVTYAGRTAKKGEAKQMADSAKRRLMEQNISANRIFMIDGGFREAAEYELFLIPSEMPAPSPTPTLASNQVTIVGRR